MGPLFLVALNLSLAAPPCVVGHVRDAVSTESIANAIVASEGSRRFTTTDADGVYALPVPAGSLRLTVRMLGYTSRTLEVFVPRDGRLEVDVTLEPDPIPLRPHRVRAAVVIRGLDGIDAHSFPDRELRLESVRNHPLSAEPDAFQALGGGDVALEPETPSGVHVRGGAADQTIYLLDGMPVFSPYHAAGLFSAWNPDALSRLRLSSTASPPTAPQALAGAIEATTRTPGSAFGARGSMSTTQARVTLDGPLGSPDAGYLASFRSGYPGLVAPRGESSYLRGETGDDLGKVEAPLAGGRLLLLAYDSENESDAGSSIAEDGAPVPPRNLFEWHARSLGARWQRRGADGELCALAWSALGGAGSAWGVGEERLNLRSDRSNAGVLVTAARGDSLTVGVRFERDRTSYRVAADTLGATPWELSARTPLVTVFGQGTRRVGARTTLALGGALVAFDGHAYAAPRVHAQWSASEKIAFHGAYARAHQFAQSLRNPESVVGGIFPAELSIGAGAAGVPVAAADLGVLAVESRPTATTRVGVQAYARGSRGLLLVAPREGRPFATGAFVVGSGRVRGASVDFSSSTKRCGVVASYGLQEVRLVYGDSTYAPVAGPRHQVEAGLLYFVRSSLSVRLGAAAAFGRRATAVAGGFEWEAHNLLDRGSEFVGSPSYDGGSLALLATPGYFRVDVGVRKEWKLRVGAREAGVAVFGSATNLLGRKNVLTYARDPATGELAPVEMRPLAPLVVGLDWRF